MNIQWKKGAHVKASAEDAHSFFESIRDNNDGVIDLDAAVILSQPEDAPLHDELEWDDSEAGHKWRKEQMRYLVRHIEIIRPDVTVPTRAYSSVPIGVVSQPPITRDDSPKQVFKSTEDLLADPAARDYLLQQAVRDAILFRRKYSMLSEMAKVISVIDLSLDEMGKEA